MRVLFATFLALIILAGFAPGQQEFRTAYAIDQLHGYFGHWNPFGILGVSGYSADESRVQQVIPAAYLPPTGGTLVAIEASPHVTGTVPYKSLVISAGHSTVSSLSLNFAANLPQSSIVYAIQNQSINWGSKASWYRINLQVFFRYDGKSNLMTDIQKIVDRPNNPSVGTVSHQYNNLPMRKDLPWPVWADGAYGSGAATANTATYRYNAGPLLMRLIWVNTRTLTVTSTRGQSAYFNLGGTVTLTTRAVAGEVYFMGIDFGLRNAGLPIPGVQGSWWLPTLFNLIWVGVVDAKGEGVFALPVPNVPQLVGTHVYFQAATAGTAGVNFTNVIDGIVSQ